MSSNPNNPNKRPAGSDTDEYEPSKADKKKSRKSQKKPPGQGKSHQPSPTFSESEYDDYETEDGELTEGEMDVVNTEQRVDYDNSPFLIDLTDDMRKFWRSETDVVVALRREYPKLDITVSKTWKGQTLRRPLSNVSQFLLYNMRSLRVNRYRSCILISILITKI